MTMNKITFINSIIKFSISSWVNFFIAIISVIFLTRLFPPDIYGFLHLFNSASSVLMSVICLGLDSSYIRFYNDPPVNHDNKQLLTKFIFISIIITLLFGFILVTFFHKQLSLLIFDKVSWLITVLLFVNTMSLLILRYFALTYRMSNNPKMYTLQNILTQVFSKLFVLVAAFFNPTYDIVISVNTTGVLILVIFLLYMYGDTLISKRFNFRLKGFGEIFQYAFFSWPSYIIHYINILISQLIINKSLGAYELGIYASAYVFNSIIYVLQTGFGTYWTSFMYSNYKTHQKWIKKIHNYVLLFTVVIMLFILVFQNFFYNILGVKYRSSQEIFSLILLSPLFSTITETTAYGISIEKKMQYGLLLNLVFMLTNLFLCLYLIQIFGISGAALAVGGASLLRLIIFTVLGQYYYDSIDNYYKTILSVIVLLLLSFINYRFYNNYSLIFSTCVVILIFTAIVFIKEVLNIAITCKNILLNFFTRV